MKVVYPIIIYEKDLYEEYHIVYVPDFNKTTQGKNIIECIEMARDLIGIMSIEFEESKEKLPDPFTYNNKYAFEDNSFIVKYETLVDIDLSEYKK